jgi:hypothetical protein
LAEVQVSVVYRPKQTLTEIAEIAMIAEIADGFKTIVNAITTSLNFNPSLFDSGLTRLEN